VPGLPSLPGTNNDLEHVFGGHRHYDRGATVRETASPALVLQRPTRLIAAAARRAGRRAGRHVRRASERCGWLVRTTGTRRRRLTSGIIQNRLYVLEHLPR
jgi:hypothetical protein